LPAARSLADVLAAVSERVKIAEPGSIVVSNGDWHEAQLKKQRLPFRRDLDTVSPNNPVVLVWGGHEYILNSAALAKWHIDKSTAAPEGGQVSRYPDGEPNGELNRPGAHADRRTPEPGNARAADRNVGHAIPEAQRSGPHEYPTARRHPGSLPPLAGYEAANAESAIAGKRWAIEHGFLPEKNTLRR
jgi:predicted amidohydrolase YtcJ